MKKILLFFKRILGIPINILKSIRTFFKMLGFLILLLLVNFCKMSRSISKYMERNPKCTVLLLLLSIVLAALLLYIDWNFVPHKTLKTFDSFYYELYELLLVGVFFFGFINLGLLCLSFFWCVHKHYFEQKTLEHQRTSTSVNLKFYENEDSDKLSIDAENVYIHSWIDFDEVYENPKSLPKNLKKVLIQDERLLKNFLSAAVVSARVVSRVFRKNSLFQRRF